MRLPARYGDVTEDSASSRTRPVPIYSQAWIVIGGIAMDMGMHMGSDERDIARDLRRFRRDLHRIPELDRDLPLTIAYIESVLSRLGCEVLHPCESCVCALFHGGIEDGRTKRASLAIRADMDALPIAEETGVAFSSEHDGRMHACGHDAHMAMALATAVAVDRMAREGRLGRDVLFVFQPAEETTGGARSVCESGVFERCGVGGIVGFHVWPDLPAGTIASRPGALLARSSETHVRIQGSARHIAKTLGLSDAHSHDAALAAATFLIDAHGLMDGLALEEPCLCRFGLVRAGTVCNAVAGDALVSGSLRVFSDDMFDRAREGLRCALRGACERFGCAGEIDFAAGYPPVVNDVGMLDWVESAVPDVARLPDPLLIAEDFAFYQRRLPGVFLLLGVGEEDGSVTDLHTCTLMFDEAPLVKGVEAYLDLVGAISDAPF